MTERLSDFTVGVPTLSSYVAGANAGSPNLRYQVQSLAGLLTPSVALTPQQFGAFGDGTSHPITAQDIANNSQWIGQYGVGMEWDYVATQECIYACFANALSTPKNIVWNCAAFQTQFAFNKRMFIPPGDYQINATLVMAAIGFYMEWAYKGGTDTFWSWTGTQVMAGNTHTSTTIDGLPSASLAKIALYPNTQTPINTGLTDHPTFGGPLFVLGAGILPGTHVTAVNAAAGSITLNQATTATASGVNILFQMPMFYTNTVAYGAFVNPSMQANVAMQRGGFFDDITNLQPTLEYTGSFVALWVINQSGAPSGAIGSAQISIYDATIQSNSLADVGVSISPSRGAAEGATIQFINPQISDFFVAGIQLGGANATDNGIYGGDFIGNTLFGVQTISGSFIINNVTFESQSNQFFSPQIGQIPNRGGDLYFGQGTGLSTPNDVIATRSEGSVLVIVSGESVTAQNCSVLAADQADWTANFPFQLGSVIYPTVNATANNTKNRSFICVDTGGTNTYNTMTISSTPSSTITDPNASYTVNQWVGYSFFFRFGSNGFTEHFTAAISANTATTVTTTGASLTPNIASIYTIGGQTAATAPNFDSASASLSDGLIFGGNRGFTLTPGSNQVTTPNNIAIGDYIVVPLGDTVGVSTLVTTNIDIPGSIVCPFIAKITNVSGPVGGLYTLTMSKAAGRYVTGGPGYWGVGLADGTQGLRWMEIDYDAAYRAEMIDGFHISGGGRITGCDVVRNIHAQRTADWYNGDPTPDLYAGTPGVPRGTVEAGQFGMRLTTALDATQATLDLTPYIETGNYSQLTPTQSMTLNAPTPLSFAAQEWTLIILTSGVSSFTLTFGTNMLSTGTLATGVTSGKKWVITFVSDGTSWIEKARSGPF